MRKDYISSVLSREEQTAQLLEPTALLFLNTSFKQISASHKITSYFKAYGYNITTTLLRKIFETETAKLRSKGLIDAKEHESVNRVIGHSPETARKTYVIANDDDIRKQRQSDVQFSARLMEQFDNPSDRIVIDYDKIIQQGKHVHVPLFKYMYMYVRALYTLSLYSLYVLYEQVQASSNKIMHQRLRI
jgi:hypothetical protein